MVVMLVALVAVVAVVAVVALPESAPEKVVVVKALVDGLNVSPVPRLMVWVESVLLATKSG